MVFKNNFVAVVVTDNKILREHDGVVTLPFGADYSLKLKNLNAQKALVSVTIDGKDVLSGSKLIIHPNNETMLGGFLDGSEVRNRFRFIQKTEQIVKHRGDRVDDGIIRVEYRFEEPIYTFTAPPVYTYKPREPHRVTFTDDQTTGGGFRGFVSSTSDCTYSGATISTCVQSTPTADEGITVRGDDASQHFNQGYIGNTGEAHVITIRLRGTHNAECVSKPIHTTTKLTCESCGLRSRSSAKFCMHCGTRL